MKGESSPCLMLRLERRSVGEDSVLEVDVASIDSVNSTRLRWPSVGDWPPGGVSGTCVTTWLFSWFSTSLNTLTNPMVLMLDAQLSPVKRSVTSDSSCGLWYCENRCRVGSGSALEMDRPSVDMDLKTEKLSHRLAPDSSSSQKTKRSSWMLTSQSTGRKSYRNKEQLREKKQHTCIPKKKVDLSFSTKTVRRLPWVPTILLLTRTSIDHSPAAFVAWTRIAPFFRTFESNFRKLRPVRGQKLVRWSIGTNLKDQMAKSKKHKERKCNRTERSNFWKVSNHVFCETEKQQYTIVWGENLVCSFVLLWQQNPNADAALPTQRANHTTPRENRNCANISRNFHSKLQWQVVNLQ